MFYFLLRSWKKPVRATESGCFLFPARWYTLFMTAVFIFLASFLVPITGYGAGTLVVFNDSLALKSDQSVGRYGGGKLYFDDPVDLAIGESGDVYILDAGNYRVQVMDEDGNFQGQWGERGDGSDTGQLNSPVALAVSPEHDFVVILQDDPPGLSKFDKDGSFLFSFGEEGRRKGMLNRPVDLTIDHMGYIYVLDSDRKKVLKYHESGAFVKEWGGSGLRKGDFDLPVSLTYSDKLTGSVYVLDLGKRALVQFLRDGDHRNTTEFPDNLFPEGSQPVKIEAAPDGTIFILDAGLGNLVRFGKWNIGVFRLRSEDVPLVKARGLAIDEEDRIYISDIKKNRTYRFPLEVN